MFFFLSTLSAFGYSIQSVLLVKYARKMDGLHLAIYRNLSLGISMSPLLFFTNTSEIGVLWRNWPQLWAASFTGILGLSFALASQKYLPLGITAAIGNTRILLIFFLAYFFEGETISGTEALCVAVTVLGVTFLAVQNHHMPHLDKRTVRGIVFAFIASFWAALAFVFMAQLSREVSPFVTAYFWEACIGISAVGIFWIRKLWTRESFSWITQKSMWTIAGISSTTLVGTGAFALAVTVGSIGIASAIVSTLGVVLGIFMAHYLYDEKLTMPQLVGIGVVCIGIVALRVV